jgi:hypothetical protein
MIWSDKSDIYDEYVCRLLYSHCSLAVEYNDDDISTVVEEKGQSSIMIVTNLATTSYT